MAVIIFIIVLSILVFVHELGHFLMAKRARMKVEEFGLGFPPRLWGVKRGETLYSINAIPFGGFVKIYGEDGAERNNPSSFSAGKLRTRAGVIVAGVVMNFLLAVVLLTVANGVGLRVGLAESDELSTKARDVKVQIIQVAARSPAERAGLKVLDEIVELNVAGQRVQIADVTQVQSFINNHRGQEIGIQVREGSNVFDKKLTPRLNPPPGEGALGISLATTGVIKYPWYQAIAHGAEDSAIILERTAIGYATIIRNIFIHGKPGIELSGPVGIAVVTGQAARLGLTYLMQFMALISINLAVLNIIPFPALDGGRLLFILIERAKGSPVSRKIEAVINTAGFALLILLMIYVTTKDIIKFF